MGHLTEIANSLQAVATRRPAVSRALAASHAWTDFTSGPLFSRNSVRRCRPPPAVAHP
jgi:hypothetical protein